MKPLLPSEAAFLRLLYTADVPCNSKRVPIKYSLTKLRTSLYIVVSREFHFLHWDCWHITDDGRQAIERYDSVTLEDTFR